MRRCLILLAVLSLSSTALASNERADRAAAARYQEQQRRWYQYYLRQYYAQPYRGTAPLPGSRWTPPPQPTVPHQQFQWVRQLINHQNTDRYGQFRPGAWGR